MGDRAVVLLSGGQDSTTCLGWACNRFSEVKTLGFIYGQKHQVEVQQAKRIAGHFKLPHKVVDISFLPDLVDSALTENGDVNESHSRLKHLPASFVPNRNALFLTLAHAYAQKVRADHIITGFCETDYSGYPDCRIGFVQSMLAALNAGSEMSIEIHTPLMALTKADAWEMAFQEGVFDLVREHSMTCYNGDNRTMNRWGMGCGQCPACQLRKKGFQEWIQRHKEREEE